MNLLLFLGINLLLIVIIIVIWILRCGRKNHEKSVCIVVLGDIGRSPRMQYHGLSFSKEGYRVDIVGYGDSKALEELENSSIVKIHHLKPVPEWNNRIPRLISYVVKTLWQAADLFWTLVTKIQSNYLLLQNPPAIPTFPVCWIYCCLFQTKFIIDWHNYAYSIMAMTVGRQNFLVKITMAVEALIGRRANANFCVTNAMKENLLENWDIKATVLYDRPPKEFQPISLVETHCLLMKLGQDYPEFASEEKKATALTRTSLSTGEIQLRTSRPALVVSSTSWTEDEDFSVLLTALKEYELACYTGKYNLPDLICAITGKGPLKVFWNSIVKLKKWKHVKIVTPWLENEDYPRLLASADLGVCLHTSSSGLDLPMKVVDMFGCGLPVCAYNFQCLGELVKHEDNSLVFSNDKELAEQLISWFKNFPNDEEQVKKNKKFREELEEFRKLRWHENWSSIVLPLFK